MPASTLAPAHAAAPRPPDKARARVAPPRWLAPAKVLAFAAGLTPFARVVLFGLTDRLGANPVEFVTRSTGRWTLVMLCITLGVTPLRRVTGVAALLRFRRMLGLFAFFYATLHFTTYVWLDKWFDLAEILKDIGKRPFITVGFAAFVLLVPLAATSPRAMVRRLGRHWATLHRAIYAIVPFGVLHFWWMKAGKHDLAQPKLYAAIVVALLGWRVAAWGWRRVRG
ncbi:protein-methionine-sulfoxide reductase heme-binding subunit MsrQ [Burkholderia ubonensis]|uniref:Protein-methionine-sulfoxide reductase heme-binding subunit MsrQ n=1 Tax=Burkholderia ubonensis TaxID=101571 RepID=A0AB74D451_9BURK|nr:protein-methionine-sulfoxide reductase heme-binding subunit MsrQ [Burkholderia ubonensis]PAJ81045.1 sulfoxide reductase heme-binding subunit YedZ [Burkholderia ubonensis]PAJ87864.1 sulfoxide reductase heme-binding subunit YedZ [Burkholderia ubonensis]PAJ93556.1 sulfoxide reductase heme-binding subunit YedZ [Burkholderia ubonensis]PAK01360.1 sulfoxide reductase heme-binding subunit YedZ [Burkholderia ubonensis]PAK08407.1 sulfoxide reductase heme-binding subunit YedZ [Burkholderia ubonensis]